MLLRSFENRAFIALVLLVTVALVWTLSGFLLPVFWATVLAILFTPLFQWVRRGMRGHNSLAALTTLLIVFVLVIVPLVVLGGAVTQEALGLYNRVVSGDINVTEPLHTAEQLLPELTQRAEELGVDFDRIRENAAQAALAVGQGLATRLLSVGQQTLQFVLLLAVTLYVLFFFLRDGDRLTDTLIRALPLGDPRERRLLTKFVAVTRATVKGTFVISAVQGAIGGVTFALLGLGSPVLWGVVMTVLSFIPAIGATIVWGPVALYLLLTGQVVEGLILIGVGAGIMGTVDNALRPILVGRDAGMPDYVILLSTLGGLGTFGVSGLVIGPVVAGLFLTVWELFTEEFATADTDDPDVPGDDPEEAAAAEPDPAALTGAPKTSPDDEAPTSDVVLDL
ncbi:AI-2E family transporter [Rubrivirga sp. S365]|uniref:AI-2E family transporter n=1 Tax=Rubrivirga sp. S365 TaxID=3076080 RepID=UPI0028C60113|nr:AI-2E family transporter [Rubrivirga sp. S365]MDT7857573.1 AI-2E family transporter [Rubrivirga sp. S365]